MWGRADRQQSVAVRVFQSVRCVCVHVRARVCVHVRVIVGPGCLRACLPLRDARPLSNPGFSGGAACSRWGHCTAPCINNSWRARESGGVCLPAQ